MKIKMLLVALLSIGVCFAFTTAKERSAGMQNTYEFRGLLGQENDPTKYWLIDGTPNHVAQYSCGVTEEIICKIVADADGSNPNHPDLSQGNPLQMPEDYQVEFRPEE